ncbi:ferredoxin reductase [Rhodococcus sp. WAY2]|uniref:ferredoxin reductase n=1 Tax=Rhodococcus sp. WAY2 TaxID=2663121 RepID=UPI0013203809|nr:ferredoxin reductase [Rhodococcus sp. WAY2]QHE68817.1 Flavodoxin reductases (ferredoxin-NADPH reductases) family 1 [Rhodococcus sp. WAY2]
MSVAHTSRPAEGRRFSLLSLFEAMATPHQLDRYLELVTPMVTVRDLRAEVLAVDRSTADTVTLTLRPTRQWRGFRAGQFVQVGVVIDGVRHTRCYSPANAQSSPDGTIELTIKAHPDGLVSQYLHENARPGLILDLSQAAGEFVLPTARPRRVLLVSGGSGITPVLSMLRTLVEEKHAGSVTFLHYAYTENDVAYLDELRELADANPNVNLVLAYTDQETGGHLHGFFGQKHLDAVAPWYAEAETFLCGPPGLMRGVREVYRELGIEDRLHTEEFAPAATPVEGEAGGELSFTASGVTADNSGGTLLEQAEAAGLHPEYGCRMGICFSCTAVKKLGCTKNVRTGDTDTDPDKAIQLCVSVPVGDVALDI